MLQQQKSMEVYSSLSDRCKTNLTVCLPINKDISIPINLPMVVGFEFCLGTTESVRGTTLLSKENERNIRVL